MDYQSVPPATPPPGPTVPETPPQPPSSSGSEPVPPKIQQHLENVPQANEAIKSHHTKKFWSAISGLILLLLLLLGAVVYFFFLGPKAATAPENTQVIAPIETPTVTPTPDPTFGWQTHENICGFTIKYPEDYIVEDTLKSCPARHHNNGYIKSPDNGETLTMNIAVDPKPKSTNFDDELSSYYPISKDQQISTTIAGNPAVKFRVSENEQAGKDGNGISTGALILVNGKFYQFNLTGVPESVAIFEQMITTLVFEEASSISAEGTVIPTE